MCDFCQANSSFEHPAMNMVDGRASWWQSPPLSRGMQYNQVNISIDLEQVSCIADRRLKRFDRVWNGESSLS